MVFNFEIWKSLGDGERTSEEREPAGDLGPSSRQADPLHTRKK